MMEEWLLLKDGGICRCCALEGPSKDLVSKYSWMGDDEIYSDMLRECFNITLVTVEEGSNGGICEVCITQLRSAYKFRQHVLHTEEQFKKKLESKILCDSAFVKLEIPPETSDTDMDPMGDNDDNSDYEVPLKKIKDELESEMELMKQKKTPAKTIASKSTRTLKKKASVEPETSKSKRSNKKTDAERKKNEFQKRYCNLKCILQYSNATLIKGQEVRGFTCLLCPMIFKRPVELKDHCIGTHRNERTFSSFKAKMFRYLVKIDISFLRCDICETEVYDLEELINHLKDEHEMEVYSGVKSNIIPFKFEKPGLFCCICDVKFTNFKVMLQHMHVHYSNFICDVCGAGFAVKAAYRCHKKRHAEGTFPCSQCKKTFDNRVKLDSHVKQIHLKIKTNRCPICYKKFNEHSTKLNHVIKVHKLVHESHKCDSCDREFSLRRHLRQHIRLMHLAVWKCTCYQCEKVFFDKSAYAEHLIKHSGEKRGGFTCDICSKVYVRKRTLRAHMRTHIF